MMSVSTSNPIQDITRSLRNWPTVEQQTIEGNKEENILKWEGITINITLGAQLLWMKRVKTHCGNEEWKLTKLSWTVIKFKKLKKSCRRLYKSIWIGWKQWGGTTKGRPSRLRGCIAGKQYCVPVRSSDLTYPHIVMQ